jgi:hypothetical protein
MTAKEIPVSEDVAINVMLLKGLCVFMVLGVAFYFYKLYKLWKS